MGRIIPIRGVLRRAAKRAAQLKEAARKDGKKDEKHPSRRLRSRSRYRKMLTPWPVLIGLLLLGALYLLSDWISPSGLCSRWGNTNCVIDGDSLIVEGQTIRLFGIDALEMRQRCRSSKRRLKWCGHEAAEALAEKIGTKKITCRKRGTDETGDETATCYVGHLDLSDWMVRNGYAVADRQHVTTYVEAEMQARARRAGIWEYTFIMPRDWREGKRL